MVVWVYRHVVKVVFKFIISSGQSLDIVMGQEGQVAGGHGNMVKLLFLKSINNCHFLLFLLYNKDRTIPF